LRIAGLEGDKTAGIRQVRRECRVVPGHPEAKRRVWKGPLGSKIGIFDTLSMLFAPILGWVARIETPSAAGRG
jgi:hypothetical protein